jgi:hypothetical protein
VDTGKAIVIGATIIAAAGAGTAWAIQPRYSLTNVGGGNSIRLDKASGDMIGCAGLDCEPIAASGKLVDRWAKYPTVNDAAPKR